VYQTAVENREEQDEMIKNLQKKLIDLEQIVHQTNEIDDVETLDQTYEVNPLIPK
jgi:hypothetical protein